MIDSATAFLPDSMMTFMNFERSTEPNFGSGRISRLGTSRRRGMGVFLPTVSVGAGLVGRPSKGQQALHLLGRHTAGLTTRWHAPCSGPRALKPSSDAWRRTSSATACDP